jgi:hypothetical protein
MSHWFHELSYPSMPVHPSLCLQYLFLLFTIATITAVILLLLLLFHYYHHYKTVATDKPLRARMFPGATELITHLLRLTYILWLPLCRINKFGFYFPRKLLRSPILVGHHGASLRVHLEATMQSARRIIARLLREDAAFFRKHHYLDPLGVDDSDNPMLWCSCTLCIERESLCFLTFLSEIILRAFYIVNFGVFAAIFVLDT